MNLNEVAVSKISKRGRVPIPLQNIKSQVQDIEVAVDADSFLPPTQKSPNSLPNSGFQDTLEDGDSFLPPTQKSPISLLNSGFQDTLEDWSASPKKVSPKRDQVLWKNKRVEIFTKVTQHKIYAFLFSLLI